LTNRQIRSADGPLAVGAHAMTIANTGAIVGLPATQQAKKKKSLLGTIG
jgi:hypothetical protein